MAVKEKDVKKVLNAWIGLGAPKDIGHGDITKLAKEAGLNSSTIRLIRNRETLSADTIIRLFLAQGVTADTLVDLPRTGKTYSPTLTEWNNIGMQLSEKSRQQLLKLIKFIKQDWKIK